MSDTTPATPPPAPPPAAPSGSGPKGKVRHPAAVIIFAIITLGIYLIFWFYFVFKELKENTGEGIGGGTALLLAILGWFTGIFTIVLLFLLPSEVGKMYERSGMEKPVRGVTGFWNLIPLIGFIIWVVKVQGAMNRRWESQ
jgi:hypothetical protein